MELGQLYQFVLVIILIGMLLGVGIIVLDRFQQTSGISDTAITTIGNTVSAITPIASTWLPLIVTVAVLAVVLILVIRSFSGAGGR